MLVATLDNLKLTDPALQALRETVKNQVHLIGSTSSETGSSQEKKPVTNPKKRRKVEEIYNKSSSGYYIRYTDGSTEKVGGH